MSPLRLIFLGSDPITLPLLDRLVDHERGRVELIAVYTQPDKPVGRGQKVTANGIKTWAMARGIPVHQPEKITREVREAYAALRPDVALVMAYGKILRPAFIDAARLGTLNLHASLLPDFRGASPIQTSVATGATRTGVSLMRIVPELDAGPVADVEAVDIAPLDTALEVEAKLAAACVPLVVRNLDALAAGTLPFVEQDHARATFCRRLVKTDGALDFRAPAAALAARINGLFPWPATSFDLEGQPIKVGLADVATGQGGEAGAQPGQVLGADADGLLVATGDGVLRMRRLQRPGGKLLPASDFLRGLPVAPGTLLPSAEMSPLLSQ